MDNINIREYIKNNFKNDTKEDIKNSIEESITSGEEDILLGLGVLFEIYYQNTSNKEEVIDTIYENIKKSSNQ